ncbi:MAG TPA: hypothetical protein VF331_02775 [Polyangiales bacterium]
MSWFGRYVNSGQDRYPFQSSYEPKMSMTVMRPRTRSSTGSLPGTVISDNAGNGSPIMEEVVHVDATSVSFGDPSVHFVVLPGTGDREAALLVETSHGTTLVLNDVIFNLANRPGLSGWLFKAFGMTGDEPHVPPVIKLRLIENQAALAAQLDLWARMPRLQRVIISHGSIVENDAAGVLARVQLTWRRDPNEKTVAATKGWNGSAGIGATLDSDLGTRIAAIEARAVFNAVCRAEAAGYGGGKFAVWVIERSRCRGRLRAPMGALAFGQSTRSLRCEASRMVVVVCCRQGAESNLPYRGFGLEIHCNHAGFARLTQAASARRASG